MVLYDDNFPRSSAGTRFWDYNDQSNNGKYGGVAHYGMIYDFLKDVSTLPAPGGYPKTGAQVVNNLMQGADYFFQTWKKCEQLKTQVDSIAVSASAPQRPAPAPQRPASSSPTYSGTWVEVRPQSGPATRLSLTQRGSQVEVRISYTGTFSGKVFGVASIQSNNSATWTVPQSCAAEFRKPGYSYDNPGESLFSLSLGEPIDGGSPEPILTYTQDTKWNVPCDGHPIGTKHTSKALQRAAPDKQ